MKISNSFANYLKQAYEEYNSQDLDIENCYRPGLKYAGQMFLMEEKDFDKVISIYSSKRFSDSWELEAYQSLKEPYLKVDFSDETQCRDFYANHYVSHRVDVWRLTDDIWDNCSYGKKETGRTTLRALLNELWYSQDDYKLIKKSSQSFFQLCQYWVQKNEVSRNWFSMNNLYQDLLLM